MQIYWYWPHPHRTADPLAISMLRGGDTLTVQALPSLHGERFQPIDEYEVVRDLPDPTLPTTGRLARLRRPFDIARGRSRARRRLIRRGFDVAHLQLLVYQTDWVGLGRLARATTLVSTVHDVRPHRSQLPPRIEHRLLGRMYQRAGHLVVYHDRLRAELHHDFGIDAARIHVVAHPFDARDQRDLTVEAAARPLFLLFGAVRENKGADVLLDALELLGDDLDADVAIVGQAAPGLGTTIAARASHLRNVRTEFGFVSAARKRYLFSRATCAVLPYTSFHAQSGVLTDAYSHRIPVIVSDVGALGPTVRADGSGLVVPPHDAAALAAALAEVAQWKAGQFTARIEVAARRHDWSVVGPQLRDIYDLAVAES